MSAPKPSSVTRRADRRGYTLFLCLALAAALAAALPLAGTKASRPQDDAAQTAAGAPKSRGPAFVPGDVLVRFKAEPKAAAAQAAAAPLLDARGREIPVTFERPEGFEIVSGLRVARVAAEDTLRAVAALRARPDVLYAEPNYVRHKLAVPNDTRYSEQWNMRGGPPGATAGAHVEGAWDTTTGSRQVVVGVVDEGFDINHPDLKANVWRNPGEIPNNGIDDDGDGFVDDVNGWDFFHDDKTVYDNPANVAGGSAPDAHGTHVAGIVGAEGNNAQGVAGVNWQVSLLSLKILGAENESPAPSNVLLTVRAYAYAKRLRDLYQSSGGALGANLRVLNNSYGGVGRSQAELDAINELDAAGILFVVAAGNDSESDDQTPVYPASYDAPNLISVAASDTADAVASFSNFGARTVHMSAPGTSILSTTPAGTYSFASGTSMAAPHVAGAAALLCAARPDLSVAKLRAALLFGGDAVASQAGKTVTGRRLNVAGSLQLALADDAGAPSVTDLRVVAQDGRSVTLAWTAPGDDGSAQGQAALYEIRFVGQAGDQFRLAAMQPGPAGLPQSATVRIPYQHQAGTLVLQAFDDAGNSGTASVAVTVDDLAANPYSVTAGPPAALTTGGTPLHLNSDDSQAVAFLPFDFPFFESYGNNGVRQVWVSSNGALFFGLTPHNDSLSYVARLDGWRMIAGLWDDLDLRTCFRPDADVYVTQDTNHVVFRWQGVHFQSDACPASPTGSPVNFEIELRSDGTVVERFGDGNQQVFPVVGISGGEPSAYADAAHTSEFAPTDLTNAQTVTFTLRRPVAKANLRISEYPFNYPYPVRVGDEFDVAVAVANAGPDRAAGVRLTSTLPKEITYVTCRTSQGACSVGNGGSVVADFGGLDNGATARAVFTLKATATASGTDIAHKLTSSTFDPSTSDNDEMTIVNVTQGNPTPLTGVVSVAGGRGHSLAVKPDGTALAWGDNSAGQLGDGGLSAFGASVAQGVPSLTGVAAVAGGVAHSLALKTTGAVWAWGDNSTGQLGDGTNITRRKPFKIPGLSNVVAVAAGGHSLALKSDGTVWAWGDNSAGQLGDGTNTNRSTPTQVPGLSGVSAIDAGQNFSVALKSDGTVWAWGGNNAGQLGDGTTTNRSTPAQVQGLSGVTAIAAGAAHALALKSDGTVWAWGADGSGQVGDGTTAAAKVAPVPVAGLSGVVSVACGDLFSLARRGDGTVWSWGANNSGQLGDGGTALQRSLPVKAVTLKGVTAIAAGGQHALALTAGGTVWTWGDNLFGQLGSGSSNRTWAYEATQQRPDPPPIGTVSDPSFTPAGGTFGTSEGVAVHVAGEGLMVARATVGGSSTLVIASDGKLYGWGYNDFGQIGVAPNMTDQFNSVEPLPRPQPQLDGVVAVAETGSNSYALKADGTVWSWGNSGALGNGPNAPGPSQPSPVQVSSLSGIKTIVAGAGHVVALANDGTVWTWGANNSGQIGDGTLNVRLTPFQVPGMTGVVAVAAMFNNTYTLKADGTVWTWGNNTRGQLGNGQFGGRNDVPQQVAGLSNVTWLGVSDGAMSDCFVAALTTDGTLWMWGSNAHGQLGDGSLASHAAPAPVQAFSNNIVVHYTTDGSDPTQDDAAVPAGGSVTINRSLTLKARAFRDGWAPSGVASAAFTVSGNPVDDTRFFVRQHYRDFLGRDPDDAGLQFWTSGIESCKDEQCREVKRIDTSAAFFLSIEFRETGFLVYLMDEAAFGDLPGTPVPVRRAELLSDMQQIGQGVIVGQGDWQTQLENNKSAFALDFVRRQRFADAYPASLSPAEFVSKLNANAGGALTPAQADALAQQLAAGGNSDAARAAVVRSVAENAAFQQTEFDRAFVLMQYIGYLQRDPDAAPDSDFSGYNFWLQKLDQFHGDYRQAEMVKAFISSTEYRHRFGSN